MTIEPSPYVRPIVQALSLLEPFIVARVSRDESSLFLVNEWRLTKEEDLSGPWLRSSDRETGEVSIKEYFAAARQDSLVEHHYKEVGAALAKLLLESSSRRVVLCAQHDIGQAFRRALPQALAAHVVVDIPFDAAATNAQMLVAARGALEKARNTEIEVLANWIKDAIGTGGRGVATFDDIVGAVRRGQVQTLLVERNLRIPGWRCMDCDWVGLDYVELCPVCEDFTVPVSDAIGELVRLTIRQNGRVEVGDNIPTLDALGGVAAILRFP
jgi:peptide subunit release factor 1 (eRF1)